MHRHLSGFHEIADQCVTPDQIPIAQIGQCTTVEQTGRNLEKVVSGSKRIAGNQIGSGNELLDYQRVRVTGEDVSDATPAPSGIQV